MSDPTSGITCPDMRRVVREALRNGWVWDGWTGTTHARIRWPETGDRLVFGSTPGLASWKSLATDIRKTSGVEVWRKGNRKRSRKADQTTGFDVGRAARETAAWGDQWGEHLEQTRQRHADAVAELDRLRDNPTRADLEKARELVRVITVTEERLTQFAVPFEAYRMGTPR